MFIFPTRISGSDSHSPALLDLFLSSDASICSIMAFPPLGNNDHAVVSVSIDFLSKFTYDYSLLIGTVFVIIGEIFHGRISLNSVLLLLPSEFCEWVQVGNSPSV